MRPNIITSKKVANFQRIQPNKAKTLKTRASALSTLLLPLRKITSFVPLRIDRLG